MICSLFSVFDPVVHSPRGGEWGVNWFTTFPLILFLGYQVGPLPSGVELLKKFVFQSLVDFLNGLSISSVYSSAMFVTVFVLLLGVNISSLTPFCYSVSAHPGWVFPIGLGLFSSSVIFGVRTDLRSFIAHFLPTGSPNSLWIFLILVEIVSVLVRPLTLAVRLVANVMSGHLFLEMISSSLLTSLSPSSLITSTLGVACLLGFELMVSVVQSHVFIILLVIYFTENRPMQVQNKKNNR